MSSTLSLQLPSHVKTVLVTGAGGYVGQQLVQLILRTLPNISLITTDIRKPPTFGVTDESRLKAVAADLGIPEQLTSLFEGQRIQGVFALHGIMSGGSEADFTLGYSVNIFSHMKLLAQVAGHARSRPEGEPLPIYVNTSSLAVYGGEKATPLSTVIPGDTPLVPETSYGVAKSVIELITYDYSRKGYLNGRTVRLPTVCIRTGAPSSAASSFISGLIREPLQGQPAVCPIASSASDPILNDMPIYVTRSKTVVQNILYAMALDEKRMLEVGGKGVGRLRTINLPGIKITTNDILTALKQAGGQQALDLVTFERDPKVIAICETWAGDYDSSASEGMGFQVDNRKTGFADAVRDFVADLKAEGK